MVGFRIQSGRSALQSCNRSFANLRTVQKPLAGLDHRHRILPVLSPQGAFPDSQDAPAGQAQGAERTAVTLAILPELVLPELAARGWGSYSAPCDYIPRRSYPLFRAREVLDYLATPGAAELLAIPTPH